MNKTVSFILIFLVSIFSMIGCSSSQKSLSKKSPSSVTKNQQKARTTRPTTNRPKTNPNTVEWLSVEEATRRSKKQPRKMIVEIYADWCGWCKKMDKISFNHPTIAKYINENYYAVKLNIEERQPIMYQNKKYKYVKDGESSYHELPAKLLNGRMTFPSLIVLDTYQNKLQNQSGFQTPQQLDALLHYFKGNEFRKTSWDIYEMNYESTIE